MYKYDNRILYVRVYSVLITLILIQREFCEFFDEVVEDPSYAAYAMSSPGGMRMCTAYFDCEVVLVPHVIDTSIGGGWAFPKDSEFLPVFKHYGFQLSEAGNYKRLKESYELKGPEQTCTEYDGNPIGIHKCFSLFGIIFLGEASYLNYIRVIFNYNFIMSLNFISNYFSLEVMLPSKWLLGMELYWGNLVMGTFDEVYGCNMGKLKVRNENGADGRNENSSGIIVE